jgi:ribosomal protein S18 acetylase RimI-like enzyme
MERADIDSVADVMARAFQNAALYRCLEADAQRRARFLRIVFRHRVAFSFDTHDADVAYDGNTITGAAIWARPDSEPRENHALEQAVRKFGGVYDKWRRFHEVLFGAFAEAYAKPHWSLAPIAVAPEFQGQGAAGALLRHKLAQIGASGAACLLGTQDEANIAIYARYGFRLIHQAAAAQGSDGGHDLVCYIMLREFS